MVSTDRISAFDYVLPTGIPDKGRVLTQTSAFWFGKLDQTHHLITTDLSQIDLPDDADRDLLDGRTMLVCKTHRMRCTRILGGIRLERISADR